MSYDTPAYYDGLTAGRSGAPNNCFMVSGGIAEQQQWAAGYYEGQQERSTQSDSASDGDSGYGRLGL